MKWHGIWPHLYPAGDEAEFIREKVEQCVLMMVVGMVSLGGSLGVVLMYIAYVSFNAGNSQSPGLQRGNENLSARSMVRPWQMPLPASRCQQGAPAPGEDVNRSAWRPSFTSVRRSSGRGRSRETSRGSFLRPASDRAASSGTRRSNAYGTRPPTSRNWNIVADTATEFLRSGAV
ncbi:uncharacterized protein [Dermacentor albipictus]|uniref:uncharacterized protein isoform X3 n=1 Tax=Dermacentor albipictus TaxID=60249 RepID=UPI0031FC6DCD